MAIYDADEWHACIPEYAIKVVLVGEERVGKTALMRRLVEDRFATEELAAMGVEFAIHRMNREDFGFKVTLMISCASGPPCSEYYRGAHVCLRLTCSRPSQPCSPLGYRARVRCDAS